MPMFEDGPVLSGRHCRSARQFPVSTVEDATSFLSLCPLPVQHVSCRWTTQCTLRPPARPPGFTVKMLSQLFLHNCFHTQDLMENCFHYCVENCLDAITILPAQK